MIDKNKRNVNTCGGGNNTYSAGGNKKSKDNDNSSCGKNNSHKKDKISSSNDICSKSGLKTMVNRKGDVLLIKEDGNSNGEVVKKVPLFDMKPYMRTPKNLIHNYTQKEKRPKPKYNTLSCENGKYRYSIVLDDPKGKEENKMIFETNESFENMELAQNYAALLALKHLQGSRPLYKLLPAPMDVAWKSMDTSTPLVTRRNKYITKKEKALSCEMELKKQLESKNKLEMNKYKEKMEIPTLSMSLNTRTKTINIIKKHIPMLSKSYSFNSWLFDGCSEFTGIPDSAISRPKLVSFKLKSEDINGEESEINDILKRNNVGVNWSTKYINVKLSYWFGVDIREKDQIVKLIENSGFKFDKSKTALDLLLKEFDQKNKLIMSSLNNELVCLFNEIINSHEKSKIYVDYFNTSNLCIVTEISVSHFPIHYIAWMCVMWLSLHVNENELPPLLSPKKTQIEVKGYGRVEEDSNDQEDVSNSDKDCKEEGNGNDGDLEYVKEAHLHSDENKNDFISDLLSKKLKIVGDNDKDGSDMIKRAKNGQKRTVKENIIRVRRNSNLSASRNAEDIVNKLKTSQILVVKGETGCGKTTQIPILLYEGITQHDENKSSMIYCTEPRRLAAISVSKRVSSELSSAEVVVDGATQRKADNDDLIMSDLVGYSVRLDHKVTTNTRLIYCTHGILTNIIRSELSDSPKFDSSGGKNMDELRIPLNSILILDEAHERSLDVDLLLYFMKQIIFIRRDIKLVIMSASIDVAEFVNYFNRSNNINCSERLTISTINLPGRTPFPIQVEYLPFTNKYFNDKASNSELEYEEDNFVSENYNGNSNGLYGNIRICKPLDILKLRDQIISIIQSLGKSEGSVLIFLGGISDVNNLVRLLNDEESDVDLDDNKSPTLPVYALPCHSNLNYSQQMEIFKPMKNKRKVIVSTNIAEVSLTIEDIRYVIDTGRVRISMYDPVKHITSLQEVFISKSSAQQRMGRAGRTSPGKCFRLYKEEDLLNQPLEITPEILRLPVEHIILDILCFIQSRNNKNEITRKDSNSKLKLANFASLNESFEIIELLNSLGDFFTPPKLYSIETSLLSLRSYGALDDLFSITPLGKLLSKWPVDINIGILFLYGLIFNCIKPLIVIASFLTCDIPWKFDNIQGININCDYMTFIKVYNYYVVNNKNRRLKLKNNIKNMDVDLSFMNECRLPFDVKYLDLSKMETVYQTIKHFTRILNIRDTENNDYLDENMLFSRWNIIQNCIAISLYPNVSCIRLPRKIKYIGKASGKFAESIKFNKLFLYIKNKTNMNRVFNYPFLSILNEDPLSKREAYNIVLESDETNRVYLSETSAIFNRMYDVGTFHCIMYLSLFKSFNNKNTILRFPIPTSMYSLLLFSSNTLEINPTSLLNKMKVGKNRDNIDCNTNYILIDDWILLQCPGLIQSIIWYFRFVIQDLTQYISLKLTSSDYDNDSITNFNSISGIRDFDFKDFNDITQLLNFLV
ncbi:rhomboid-like protein [Cryptosporidium xiaoi]|uniref:Rhomboid-like protein n=1 Tax=Cryptosporidium xiaoi TaxID=659607 RepID=A0AAV9XV03_9CRYT